MKLKKSTYAILIYLAIYLVSMLIGLMLFIGTVESTVSQMDPTHF